MNIEMKLQSYGDVECQVPLSKRTTFRIGGTCKYFIYPKNELCLLRILDILEEEGIPHRIFGKEAISFAATMIMKGRSFVWTAILLIFLRGGRLLSGTGGCQHHHART